MNFIERFSNYKILIILFITIFSNQIAFAGGDDEKISDVILHHIKDSHEWHLATIGETHITIPLPVILYTENGLDVFLSSELHHTKHVEIEHNGKKEQAKKLVRGNNTYLILHEQFMLEGEKATLYDFSITKNVASLFLSVILLFVVFFTVAKGYKKNAGKAPKGLQSMLEPFIMFVRDDIAKGSIGAKYERFTPYLLTVFFFIWFNNMMGLLPGAANLTGNIAVTMVLAVFTFLITQFSGNKNYWIHIFNTPGVPWWLKYGVPIMPLVEFIGIFTKPFSLMVRLFANVTAGHIIMLSLFSLIFIAGKMGGAGVGFGVAPVSVAFATAMTFLELLVALIQAYVFTLLSALYFGAAVAEDHH